MQLAIRKIEQIPDYYTIEEARILFNEFHKRYQAQLSNTRKSTLIHRCLLIQKTGMGKRYAQLPAFIRTMIYYSLKAQS